MPLTEDDKDEIRSLIAREAKKIVSSAFSSVLDAPINIMDGMSPEKRQERDARNKIVQEVRTAAMKAVDANLREADARIVEKIDPARARLIRDLVPEF